MDIKLEKDGEGPVYRQLAGKIISMIREEQILGGEKLPPERELAEQLEIARGTVKKAYELVEQEGLVRIIHGKGTFALAEEDPETGSRKHRALHIIGDALNKLDALRFTLPEIGSMVQVMIMERERRLSSFHIAFVDCNPEALAIFEKQILYVSRMQIHKYLLDEVAMMEDPEKVFSAFDLILTTTTHYQELAERIPRQKDKVLQAAVSPDRITISELASIPRDEMVTVLYRSDRFYRIIASWLKEFGITGERIGKQAYSVSGDGKNHEFQAAEGKRGEAKWMVIPPELPLSLASQAALAQGEEHHQARGPERYPSTIAEPSQGRALKIIPFRYMIQRGSIIHIEERISRILDEGEVL